MNQKRDIRLKISFSPFFFKFLSPLSSSLFLSRYNRAHMISHDEGASVMLIVISRRELKFNFLSLVGILPLGYVCTLGSFKLLEHFSNLSRNYSLDRMKISKGTMTGLNIGERNCNNDLIFCLSKRHGRIYRTQYGKFYI